VAEGAASHGLIIRLFIQTIRRDRSGSVWTDGPSNVSRPDPSGADQIDAEHQATDLVLRWSVSSAVRVLPVPPLPCSPGLLNRGGLGLLEGDSELGSVRG
jgi:hypothetical protein